MEEQKKKRASAASIVCWILGVCLIIVGVVLPQLMFKKTKHTFSVDSDPFGKYYEFEVDINENIKTDSAIAKIKIEGVKTESFALEYNIGESEYGEYVFVLELNEDKASIFNEVVQVEITASSGKVIVFENEDVVDNLSSNIPKIILTVLPMFFGVFLIALGFMLIVAKKSIKHIKKVNDKIMNSLFGDDEEDQPKVQMLASTITCKYCKLENDPDNAKCEHCGAPLIRNKK